MELQEIKYNNKPAYLIPIPTRCKKCKIPIYVLSTRDGVVKVEKENDKFYPHFCKTKK